MNQLPSLAYRRAKLYLPFVLSGMILLSLSLFGCTSKHAKKNTSNANNTYTAFSGDYRQTDWFLALSSYFTSESLSTQSSQAHLNSVLTLIANKCGEAASAPWFSDQLSTKLNALTLLKQPQSIDFSAQHINNECAGIIAYLASTRYHHPFLLDLSHNNINHEGVASLQQILSTDRTRSLGDIEIILHGNPLISHVSKYFATESSEKFDWLQWHFDQNSLEQRQDGLIRRLIKDALVKNQDKSTNKLSSQSIFAPGMRGIKSLIEFAGGYQDLSELNLTAPQNKGMLNSEACLALPAILKHTPYLERLTISNHRIGDKGAKMILQAIQLIPIHLKLLNLSGTDITNKTIHNILNTLPQSRLMLILRHNDRISSEALLKASNQRPLWVIIN